MVNETSIISMHNVLHGRRIRTFQNTSVEKVSVSATSGPVGYVLCQRSRAVRFAVG